jgi:ornithine--oxo-acid transaminase
LAWAGHLATIGRSVATLLAPIRTPGDAMNNNIASAGAPLQDVCARNYAPLPVTLVRGSGVFVWDDNGRRYLDMMSAYSAVSHGHAHPALVAALAEQAQKLAIVSRAFSTDRLEPFLRRACEMTGMDMALPMNTGAEAVETAIKAARKWAYRAKGVAEDECEIIACEGNFHGRTLGAIALSTERQYREGFGPFMPGVRIVPFGDADALEHAITPNTGAFLVEPMQGEAGIRIPPQGYLARCAEICRNHGVLLIADEVQTGLGRTGALLACDHEQVKPDGLVLGKALGGGLLPVSLFLACRDVMRVFTPGDHGSTFGGNPLSSAVGLVALELLEKEQLIERSARLGEYLLAGLRSVHSPLIREVRGKGLWCGVEFDPQRVSARRIAERLLEAGILTKDAHETVIRFAPPLVIEREQIDWALETFRQVIDKCGAHESEKRLAVSG